MAIIKYANQSGVVYAYESISEWDPEKKQSRSKRKCLGRVDPDTGEIVPTSGRRGRSPKDNKSGATSANAENVALTEELKKLWTDYEELKKKNLELTRENKKLKSILSKIKIDLSDI